MKYVVLSAMLLAAPALVTSALVTSASAQGTGQTAGTTQGPNPQREPNLANPQAQDNQGAQPPLAHTSGDTSQATTVPTPTLNKPMTPTRQ